MIAQILQGIDRVDPLRATWVSTDENQLSVTDGFVTPTQEVLELGWFTVFIDTHDGRIHAEPGILEVIRITAKESGGSLWCPDQTHVGVFLVSIQMRLSTTVERHNITSQAGLFCRLLFDLGDDCAALCGSLFGIVFAGDCCVDAIGDIVDGDQLIELQIGSLQFVADRFGKETVFDQVSFGRA